MTKHNKYTVIGFKALQRAAAKVAEDARKNNYKIPVWRNGSIVYKIPGEATELVAAADSQGRGHFDRTK
jgi:hypothetical protein